LIGTPYEPLLARALREKSKTVSLPADKSTASYNGTTADRHSQVSMNGWVASARATWMQPASGSAYKLNFKQSDMHNPRPGPNLVWIDERENMHYDGCSPSTWWIQGASATGSICLPPAQPRCVLSFAMATAI